MADNTTLSVGTGGDVIATDDIGGTKHQRVKVEFGGDGVATEVQTSAPLPVRLGDGTDQANVTAAGELNVLATAQPGVDVGDVTVNNGAGAAAVNVQDGGNSLTVDGPLTKAELLESLGQDIFRHLLVGQRNNQIEIDFSTGDPGTLVTVTASGGGVATAHEGHAHFSSSTGANGTVKGETVDRTQYRPLHELYAAFTAAFTPGVANSHQRIGLHDDANGIFVGYQGTQAGVTIRRLSVDSFTAQTSFSNDTLTGGAGSKFTRGGTPEAIDWTKTNVFLIALGWLGSAPMELSVLSPDGRWVLFHRIAQPNVSAEPSLGSASLPMRVHVVKTGADATDLIVRTACWAAGSTTDLGSLAETITDRTIALLTRSVIFAKRPNGTYGQIVSNTQGRLLIGDDSIGDTGAAVPTAATMVGGSDGTNLRAVRTAADGTVRTDPTGTTTQPVSGTVTANAGTGTFRTDGGAAHDAPVTGNPNLVAGRASAAAPTDVSADGDAVSAWHLRNGALATVITAAGALVGGDVTNGLDVDVTRLPALPAGTNNIGDVDVLTLPNVTLAAGTNTNEVVGDAAHDAPVAGNPLLGAGRASAAAPTDVSADGDVVTEWRLRNGAGAVVLTAAGALIGGDAINGLDVDVTRVTGTVTTKETRAATPTQSSVPGSATSVSLLASNANRLGATIFNDSTAVLRVKLGTTASSTSFTVKMLPDAYYEVPFAYTGAIDGIWDSATGNARITELAA